MLLIPLLSFTLYILYGKFPLAAASASKGISDKVALHPPTSGYLRPMKAKYSPITAATITITVLTVTPTTTTFTTSPLIRNDLLCNNDSEFVCVCQQNAGNLLKHYVLCNELIEVYLALNFKTILK